MTNPKFSVGDRATVGPNLLSKHKPDREKAAWQGTIVRVNCRSVEVKPVEGGYPTSVLKERIAPAY